MFFGNTLIGDDELVGDNVNDNGVYNFPMISLYGSIQEIAKFISFMMKSIDLTNEKILAKLKFSG
jgi:hypothetical protein